MVWVDPLETLSVNSEERPLNLEKIQIQPAEFARGVFDKCLKFYKLHTNSSVSNYLSNDDFEEFNVEEALVILSYIFRPAFRKIFTTLNFQACDAARFEEVVMAYRVRREGNYFRNCLVWMGYVFDFTMYCDMNNNGMDYFELAVQCFSKYPDIQYFYSQGGWTGLYKASDYFTEVFDMVLPIVLSEKPKQNLLNPFFYYVYRTIENKRENWFWSSSRGIFIKNIYIDLMKQYNLDSNLDLSRVTDRIGSRMNKSPKSIQQTSLLSPQQASSKTSSQTSSDNTTAQKIPLTDSPLLLSTIIDMLERSVEVGQLFSDAIETLSTSVVDEVRKLSKSMENVSIKGVTENLTLGESCFEIDKELPIETQKLCRSIIETRLEQEKKAGVSWNDLAAEPSNLKRHSKLKSGIHANVASCSESPDTCPSIEVAQIQKVAEIPKDFSSLQADLDIQRKDRQISNENAGNGQKQKEPPKKQPRSRKNKRKK